MCQWVGPAITLGNLPVLPEALFPECGKPVDLKPLARGEGFIC